MIPMNFMKSKAGFTLVELIVVIAILGILAGIAVPAYSGYIKKAESAADMQVLSTVNTAVQGLVAAEGSEVAKITLTETKDDATKALDKQQGTITVAVTAKDTAVSVTDAEVQELTGILKDMFRAEFKGATWTNGEWKLGEPTT